MSRPMFHRTLGALVALVAALALAYPRQGEGRSALRVAHEGSVLSLDPAAASEAATQSVLSNFFDGLVAFDRDMKVVPALAEAWTTPDERTWLFLLRNGVRFHDGAPLSASDVVFTLDRARNHPGSRVKAQLQGVASVTADGRSVRIVTSAPDPLLLNRLAYVLIVPRARANDLAERPIGTGPYRFLARHGKSVEAAAFPQYWGGPPAVGRVQFMAIEDGNQRLQALEAGHVDVLRYVPPTMTRAFESHRGTRVLRRRGLTSVYLWLDSGSGAGTRSNPFADRRVRRALSLAIDREAFVTRLDGMPTPAHQLVAPGVFGHAPGAPALAYDPEGARRLLAAAGFPDGFGATLVHAAGSPAETLAASLAAEMLGHIGIRLRTEPMDWPRMVDAWGSGRLPLFIAGWRFENGDALSFFQDCLLSRDPLRGLGGFNPGFADPRIDTLIEDHGLQGRERLDRHVELASAAMREMPLVPLYNQQDIYAASTAVRWQPRLDAKLLAAEMSFATP